MTHTRRRRSAHDPGVVLTHLAVMLADGGDCLADIAALRDQPELFGRVGSDPTVWRVVDSIHSVGLRQIADARAAARLGAWAVGAAPDGPPRSGTPPLSSPTAAARRSSVSNGRGRGRPTSSSPSNASASPCPTDPWREPQRQHDDHSAASKRHSPDRRRRNARIPPLGHRPRRDDGSFASDNATPASREPLTERSGLALIGCIARPVAGRRRTAGASKRLPLPQKLPTAGHSASPSMRKCRLTV